MSSGIEGDLDDEFGREIELENLYENIKSLEERNAILVEALKFFAEPYTWSRVWADADSSEIGSGALNNMYGSMAREALKKAGVE